MQSILIKVFGMKNFLVTKQLQFIFTRSGDSKKQTNSIDNKNTPTTNISSLQQTHIKSIQKTISIYLVSSAISSVLTNIFLQKKFPSFSTSSPSKLILDLGLASIFIGGGLYLSLNAIQSELNLLKKLYIKQNNKEFIRLIEKNEREYNVKIKEQMRGVLTDGQYQLWKVTDGVNVGKIESL